MNQPYMSVTKDRLIVPFPHSSALMHKLPGTGFESY
jgi:hypothetical protein